MRSRGIGCALIATAIVFLVAARGDLGAGEPLEAVKTVTDRALQVLKDPLLQPADKKEERIERLKQIINPLFDYEETAKRALGAHWRRRSPAERHEFVKLFRLFLERIYSDRIDEYAGEGIVLGREVIENGFAEIHGTIVSPSREESPVVFKLRRVAAKWLVYDAVVEHISIVNNYRSQFDRVIRSSSYEELVKKIREKVGS